MAPQGGQLAEWGARLGGRLLDNALVTGLTGAAYFLGGPVLAVLLLMTTRPDSEITALIVIIGWIGLMVVAVASAGVWNTCYRRGKMGRTLGQQAVKIRTVDERTGQVIGFGRAFLRELCHVIDGLPCGIGYLAPLWDVKNQTWADKIMGTVVVEQLREPTPPSAGYGPSPYGQGPYGPSPYGQGPYGPSPYGQSPYGPSPYGQSPYGPSPYGQSPYGGHAPRPW